ncbi:unnamed protein product [Schistocephalus solidus]|uniref:C2H2-type domain-containing protein n=1 Tax=Schistocephalus solidus TaxID=70667 RepID=A0A183SJW1_SCHSO|nr:unnamed protein product [Schistocephalus solidus]
MDDERLPKRLFYGDFATGAHRQEGQKRRYKDTLKKSLKQLQINSVTWEDLEQDRPAWRRSVKTVSAIYGPTGSLPSMPKERHESHQRPGPTPSMPRPCQHALAANPPSDSSTLTPDINSITPTIIETTSQYSSPVTPTTATTTTVAAAVTTTTSNVDSLLNCPQCDNIFTSRIGLVGHLDMRIHDSRIPLNADNSDTPCKPSAPAIRSATATHTTKNDILPASTDFSCPHCARNFNSRIGLVGHLRP